MSYQQREQAAALLKPTLTYEDFKEVDLVIEAVVEDLSLKQRVFADLEAVCPPNCIFASVPFILVVCNYFKNTSTLSIEDIGAKTKAANRIIGMHFFAPAHVMPLLEIIRTPAVSPQVILDALHVGLCLKKTSIVVGNCIGFTVNRIFSGYTQAAFFLGD